MFKKKIIFSFLLFTTLTTMVMGCSFDQQIFKQKEDPYLQVAVNKSDLEENTYYVKSGTKFYKTFTAPSLGNYDKDAILYLNDSERAVPIYYKGEYIAVTSSDSTEFENVITRYKCTDYTFGTSNLIATKDGYYCMSNNIAEDSSLYTLLENENPTPKELIIADINGIPLTEEDISEVGIIQKTGLNRGGAYTLGYYIGSYYKQMDILVDTKFLVPFEKYEVDYSLTENGYSKVKLPDDAKSGYYAIGSNVFIYLAQEKSNSVSINDIDMNEKYYLSENDSIFASSQQYSFILDTIKENMEVTCNYVITEEKNAEITKEQKEAFAKTVKAILTSPDGTEYSMNVNPDTLTITSKINTAIAGEWTVNIVPRTLSISNIDVKTDNMYQESTENEYVFTFNEETSNIKFYINYIGEGNVHAIIISPSGNTYDFSEDAVMNQESQDGSYYLSYVMAFLTAGDYKVKVYHNTDTDIKEVSYLVNEGNETDIIQITE